jgi:hypothetical protein
MTFAQGMGATHLDPITEPAPMYSAIAEVHIDWQTHGRYTAACSNAMIA